MKGLKIKGFYMLTKAIQIIFDQLKKAARFVLDIFSRQEREKIDQLTYRIHIKSKFLQVFAVFQF